MTTDNGLFGPVAAPRGKNGRASRTRREFDYYPTPPWMTNHLLDRVDLGVPPGNWDAGCRCDGADILATIRPGEGYVDRRAKPIHEQFCPGIRPPRIFEPCVGQGHIVNTIRERWGGAVGLYTNDLDPRHPADFHADATGPDLWAFSEEGFDWVITNPPFSDAFPIIRQAVETAHVGVAALLRVTWLEPTEARGLWLQEHPPTQELIMERYSFDGSGKGDSATSAWFIWAPHLPTKIEVIVGRGKQEALL